MEQVKEKELLKYGVITGPYKSRHGYYFWTLRDKEEGVTKVGAIHGNPGELVTWFSVAMHTVPLWVCSRMLDAFFTVPDDMLKD